MCNITCKNVSTHSEKLSVIFMLYGRTSLLSSLVLRKECFAAFLCCLFCFVALVLSVGHKVCIFFAYVLYLYWARRGIGFRAVLWYLFVYITMFSFCCLFKCIYLLYNFSALDVLYFFKLIKMK